MLKHKFTLLHIFFAVEDPKLFILSFLTFRLYLCCFAGVFYYFGCFLFDLYVLCIIFISLVP